MEAQEAHNTTSSSLGCPPEEETPPAEPTTSPARVDVKDTPPGTAEIPLRGDAVVLLTKSDTESPKDLPTNWAASPTKVETQAVPTTRSVVKLANPPHPIQPGRRKNVVCFDCNCFYGEAEFGSHWGYPWRHGDCLSWESGL